MNTENNHHSAPAETFVYTDLAPQTFPAVCAAKLRAIKTQLVRRFTAEFSDLQTRLIRRAVDEAEALAAMTEMPLLLFPTWAEEKVQSTRNWSLHQREILQLSGLALAE
jgi:hypothetical protein